MTYSSHIETDLPVIRARPADTTTQAGGTFRIEFRELDTPDTDRSDQHTRPGQQPQSSRLQAD